MTFEAGSPIQSGDVVAIGADGKLHAVPRRHDWDTHDCGAVCKVCGVHWGAARQAFDPGGRDACPGEPS